MQADFHRGLLTPGAGTAMRMRCAFAALLAVTSVTLGARQPPTRGHRDADAAGAGTFAIAPRTRTATVSRTPFGTLPGGTTVDRFTLVNEHGIEVGVMSYGATIMSVRTPDRTGRVDDIVLGFDTLDAYLTRSRYFGAVVGRYGNRIAGGRFTLDGAAIQLTINSGANHLHGGDKGFDKVVWEGEPFDRDGGVGVVFRHTSPDGEESYPGTLKASITYTLTSRDELLLEYRATTDKATPINLTNHSYFNLAARAARSDGASSDKPAPPRYPATITSSAMLPDGINAPSPPVQDSERSVLAWPTRDRVLGECRAECRSVRADTRRWRCPRE